MSDWKEYKLGDLAEVKGGKRLPLGSNLTETPTNHPYIRTRDINNNKIIISDLLYVPEEVFPRIKSYTVEKGDIVLSIVGTIGLCSTIPDILHHASLTENCAKIINIDSSLLDNRYLFYYLISAAGQDEILSRNVGSTQPKLPLYNIKDIPLLLPPLSEQRAIADVLSSLDDKIDLLHRQNKTLETIAEALFRHWFIEGADEGWKEVPLSHFADNIRENVKVEDISNYEYYVGLEHIPRKRIILDSWSDTGSIESNKSIFKKYDILFGKLRSYFHKVVCTPINGVCSTDILVIRPKKVQWLPFCLFWFFSKDVVDHSDLGSGGTRMPRTSWEIVSSYKVPCPPAELVMEFDKLVWPSLSKMFLNIDAICTLKKLRDTLLPQLMSGEMRVDV